jgi:hypothetical protein
MTSGLSCVTMARARRYSSSDQLRDPIGRLLTVGVALLGRLGGQCVRLQPHRHHRRIQLVVDLQGQAPPLVLDQFVATRDEPTAFVVRRLGCLQGRLQFRRSAELTSSSNCWCVAPRP